MILFEPTEQSLLVFEHLVKATDLSQKKKSIQEMTKFSFITKLNSIVEKRSYYLKSKTNSFSFSYINSNCSEVTLLSLINQEVSS